MAWLLGLGCGEPAAHGTWFYATYGYAWTFMGFPTNTAGPLLLRLGIDTSTPLRAALLGHVFRRDRHGSLSPPDPAPAPSDPCQDTCDAPMLCQAVTTPFSSWR